MLYLAAADIHAERERLIARGVSFLDEPHVIFSDADGIFGPAGEDEWFTFFHDSEGNVLALSERRRASP